MYTYWGTTTPAALRGWGPDDVAISGVCAHARFNEATITRLESHPTTAPNGHRAPHQPTGSKTDGGRPTASMSLGQAATTRDVETVPPKIARQASHTDPSNPTQSTHELGPLDEAADKHRRCPSPTVFTAPPRPRSQPQKRPPATRHSAAWSTATDIVTSLALPTLPTRLAGSVRPLPVTKLHPLPRDTSMLYGIARVDASGRVSERHIVHALGWQPGDRLAVALIARGVVLHASEQGPLVLPPTRRLVIPLTARRHCDLEAGDHVLLAAAPEFGVVIVYTFAALDDMVVQYHTPSLQAHDHEQP